MIGVDIGLRVGSIILVKKGVVKNSLVIKRKGGNTEPFQQIKEVAQRFVTEIKRMNSPCNVALEEPILSWSRRNPQAYGKLMQLFALIRLGLKDYNVIPVNNRMAKRVAGIQGTGPDRKLHMIKAYKRVTGSYPGHSTKYGKETLADAYFIALAGTELHRKGRKG